MCSNCAGDYEDPDMTAEPEPDDEFQDLLERAWEADQRRKAKALCLAGLLALGLVPRSLVRER
jgi:hypothetical protein